tara:strand:- start:37 stop:372 length:336 start_codon:yes stop_codon:yes gene_type:complete
MRMVPKRTVKDAVLGLLGHSAGLVYMFWCTNSGGHRTLAPEASPGKLPLFHLQQYASLSRKKSGSNLTPWLPVTDRPNEVEGKSAAEQIMGGGGGGLGAPGASGKGGDGGG